MEIRVWLPESWSALKYMIKHPKSFVIGVYGYKKWLEEHHKFMEAQAEVNSLEKKLQEKNIRLKELGKELSSLKRK